MNKCIALVLACVLGACVTAPIASVEHTTARYDYERHLLHPMFSVYHSSADSSELLMDIPAKDLLFAKHNETGAFHADFELMLVVSGDTLWSKHSVKHSPEIPMRSGVRMRFPYAEGQDGRVYVQLIDPRRARVVSASVQVLKSEKGGHQDYLIEDAKGKAYVPGTVSSGATVYVSCARCEAEKLDIYQKTNAAPLPPPPFSANTFQADEYTADNLILSPFWSDNRRIQFQLSEGRYLISENSNTAGGRPLITVNPHFPEVSTTSGMAESLRYITSRTEFANINAPYNQRPDVEAFWNKCSDDREKVRDLIRIYYARVREANAYFTEAVPGWKTDRGLVHVVFGNPKKTVVESDQETWIYGEEDNLNALVFRFHRVSNGHTTNRFVMERNDQLMKTRWERAVTSWRNGRIYAE